MPYVLPNYNDSNRAFLQAFMARSSMTFDEARPILAAILSARGMLFPSLEKVATDSFIWYRRTRNLSGSSHATRSHSLH